jgi:hypothetical protein
MNTIIVTSIPPVHPHKDNINEAILSWKRYGDVYSLNSPKEIEQLKKEHPNVFFRETHKTMQHLVNKPLVSINSLIDLAITQKQNLLIVNADIIISKLPELKDDGVTIFSRYDFKEDMSVNEMFVWGFDLFHIPNHLLHLFPPSIYALGSTWFDLAIPFRAIESGVPVYYPEGKFIFHKWHNTQWPQHEWEKMAMYFRWEFGFPDYLTGGQTATRAMSRIKLEAIKY